MVSLTALSTYHKYDHSPEKKTQIEVYFPHSYSKIYSLDKLMFLQNRQSRLHEPQGENIILN